MESRLYNQRVNSVGEIFNFIFPQIYIYLFALAPILAYLTRTYLDMAFENVMAAIGYAVLFLVLLGKLSLNLSFKIPNYVKWLFVFSIYTILSDIFIVGGSLNIKYVYQHQLFMSVIALLILENTYFSKKFIDNIMKISFVILVIAFIVLVIQQTINPTFIVNPDTVYDLLAQDIAEQRFPSIYSWGSSGIDFGLCFIPLLGLWINRLYLENNKLYYLLLLMGFIAVFIHRSRWAILNYFLLLIIFLIYRKFKLGSLIKFGSLIILIVIFAFSLMKISGVPVDIVLNERILQNQAGGFLEGTVSARRVSIEAFSQLFKNNPYWGAGSYKYGLAGTGENRAELESLLQGRSSQIHVGYLALFYRYGVVGGIFYLLFLVGITRKIYGTAKESKFWGVFLGWLGFLVGNLTMVIFPVYVAGLLIIFAYNKYLEQTYVTK